jgi:hypothetical protein
MQAASLFDGLSFDDFPPFEYGRSHAEVHAMSMSDWSDEETNDPLVADVRNFYKVEKWTRDGTKVDRLPMPATVLTRRARYFREGHQTPAANQIDHSAEDASVGSVVTDRDPSHNQLEHRSSRSSNYIRPDSKRLKQFELSGRCKERFSLNTYPDELTAREAEFRQETKYGKWSGRGG